MNSGTDLFAQKEEKMKVSVIFHHFIFPRKSSIVLERLFF